MPYSVLCEDIAMLCCIRITILIFIYLFLRIRITTLKKKRPNEFLFFWFVLGTVMHNYGNKRKEKVCVYVFGSFCFYLSLGSLGFNKVKYIKLWLCLTEEVSLRIFFSPLHLGIIKVFRLRTVHWIVKGRGSRFLRSNRGQTVMTS